MDERTGIGRKQVVRGRNGAYIAKSMDDKSGIENIRVGKREKIVINSSCYNE